MDHKVPGTQPDRLAGDDWASRFIPRFETPDFVIPEDIMFDAKDSNFEKFSEASPRITDQMSLLPSSSHERQRDWSDVETHVEPACLTSKGSQCDRSNGPEYSTGIDESAAMDTLAQGGSIMSDSDWRMVWISAAILRLANHD